jgi:hypothetical protein
MCLKLDVDDNVGQVTLHSVNNTVMQLSDAFLFDYNEGSIGIGWSNSSSSNDKMDEDGNAMCVSFCCVCDWCLIFLLSFCATLNLIA